MSRRFTWWEAEEAVPRVDGLLREAIALKEDFRRAERAFEDIGSRIMLMGGVAVDREAAATARQDRERSAGLLKQAIEKIHRTGCLVKDLDIGLVDFPTLFEGREVYLCWKLGEPSIAFWHGTEEGFAGRKPIDEEFLTNHRGD
jgi:hypothetical protein